MQKILVALVLTVPALTSLSAQSVLDQRVAGYLDLKPSASVGTLRAGLICLPSGQAYVSDFVTSQDDFQKLVDDAVHWHYAFRPKALESIRSVRLKSVRTKLCARRYGVFGLGDKSSHSGNADFVFEVSSMGSERQIRIEEKVVSMSIPRDDPLPLRSVLPLALRDLLERVL